MRSSGSEVRIRFTSSLAFARAYFSATLLLNGKVLVSAGGGAVGSAISSAELYDSSDVSPVTDIPTLSEWALMLLAAVLGLIGMAALRRRQTGAA